MPTESFTSAELAIEGAAVIERTGPLLWPRLAVRSQGATVARLGPRSWIWIYLGPGQRVRLATGEGGRVTARQHGRMLTPIVRSDDGSVLAKALPGPGGIYMVNVAGGGYRLVPHARNTWRARANRWDLRRRDLTVADLTLAPSRIVTAEAVPLSAVLLAFTVMSLGIPGEEDLGLRTGAW